MADSDIFRTHPDDPQITDSLYDQLTKAALEQCQSGYLIVSELQLRYSIAAAYKIGYRIGRYARPRPGGRRKIDKPKPVIS